MKYLVIVFIISVIILTNIITVCTTIIVNDYLWQQRIDELETNYQDEIYKTEYDIFSSVHRTCMIVSENNKTCNLSGHNIYSLYKKNWNPLPGFDFDLITYEKEKNTY